MSALRMKVGKIANHGLNSGRHAPYRISGERAGQSGGPFDGEEVTELTNAIRTGSSCRRVRVRAIYGGRPMTGCASPTASVRSNAANINQRKDRRCPAE